MATKTTTNANANTTPEPYTERMLAERMLRNAATNARDDFENAQGQRADWSTLKSLAIAQIKMDIFVPLAERLDRGGDIRELVKTMVETLTENLIKNNYHPTSTCPFSNAIEIARADTASNVVRHWGGILRSMND